jgi:hypothetical protein
MYYYKAAVATLRSSFKRLLGFLEPQRHREHRDARMRRDVDIHIVAKAHASE